MFLSSLLRRIGGWHGLLEFCCWPSRLASISCGVIHLVIRFLSRWPSVWRDASSGWRREDLWYVPGAWAALLRARGSSRGHVDQKLGEFGGRCGATGSLCYYAGSWSCFVMYFEDFGPEWPIVNILGHMQASPLFPEWPRGLAGLIGSASFYNCM